MVIGLEVVIGTSYACWSFSTPFYLPHQPFNHILVRFAGVNLEPVQPALRLLAEPDRGYLPYTFRASLTPLSEGDCARH